MMKVTNFTSNRGNKVANQFIITGDNTTSFQSYGSVIVQRKDGAVLLDEYYWDYSKTTSKYRNQFLNETKKETQAKIRSGEYKLVNLN